MMNFQFAWMLWLCATIAQLTKDDKHIAFGQWLSSGSTHPFTVAAFKSTFLYWRQGITIKDDEVEIHLLLQDASMKNPLNQIESSSSTGEKGQMMHLRREIGTLRQLKRKIIQYSASRFWKSTNWSVKTVETPFFYEKTKYLKCAVLEKCPWSKSIKNWPMFIHRYKCYHYVYWAEEWFIL